MVMLDYMCVQSFMSIHTQCFMLIVKDKVIHVHRLRLVAIGYEYATDCHDNGNVGLHACAKFHDHTHH